MNTILFYRWSDRHRLKVDHKIYLLLLLLFTINNYAVNKICFCSIIIIVITFFLVFIVCSIQLASENQLVKFSCCKKNMHHELPVSVIIIIIIQFFALPFFPLTLTSVHHSDIMNGLF